MQSPSRLLDRAFKLRFGLKLCLLTLAGGAAVVLVVYLAMSRALGPSYASAIYTIYELKIKIAPLVFASSYSVVILAIITAAIAVISTLFSHRIAGPIYRMERNLEEIASGDLTVNTRFRGSDQLCLLAGELNAMVRSLNHASRSAMDALEDIRAAEERLREVLCAQDPPARELDEAKAALRAAVDELCRAMSNIKVRP